MCPGHPPRPCPRFALGWLVRRGKPRALWASTLFNLYRTGFETLFLWKSTPDFGGMYEDPRFRLTVFAFIIWATASVLILHIIALAGSLARRRDS